MNLVARKEQAAPASYKKPTMLVTIKMCWTPRREPSYNLEVKMKNYFAIKE